MDYKTFPFPELLDPRMLLVWMLGAIVVFFIFCFICWKNSDNKAWATTALTATILGIIAVPVIYFGGPAYNAAKVADTVAEDYGVTVTQVEDIFQLVVADNGQFYSCDVQTETNLAEYYVLCDIPDGYWYLEKIL